LAAAVRLLRRRRFRVTVAVEGRGVAAEKGYLREAGNLVFHLALFGLRGLPEPGGVRGVRLQLLRRQHLHHAAPEALFLPVMRAGESTQETLWRGARHHI
jgi:hypothetical protein